MAVGEMKICLKKNKKERERERRNGPETAEDWQIESEGALQFPVNIVELVRVPPDKSTSTRIHADEDPNHAGPSTTAKMASTSVGRIGYSCLGHVR